MADQGSALVVWGSTGRRLQFSMQDLKMPEGLRESPHFHFYEKHWSTVAHFWFNRVLKTPNLQHHTVEDIVSLIREDIEKRWNRRRQEQSIYKKRKRLLQSAGPAGNPSKYVVLTNVTSLAQYNGATEAEQRNLVEALIERVEDVAKEKVGAWQVLVDDVPEPPCIKGARGETENATPIGQPSPDSETCSDFDDRVAVILTLSTQEKAANVIAHIHGSKFDDHRVLCRFWNES